MARTIVQGKKWFSNGRMVQDDNTALTFTNTSETSNTSTFAARSILKFSHVIQRSHTIADKQIAEQHSSMVAEKHIDNSASFEDSDREVLYFSPSTSKKRSEIEHYETEHNNSGYRDHMLNDSYDERNTHGYLLMWRKCLYFILSKPTHCDVEILSQIHTIGKKKIVLGILLPFILYLLWSAFNNKSVPISNSASDFHDYFSLSSLLSGDQYEDSSSISAGIINGHDNNLLPSVTQDNESSSWNLFIPLLSFIPFTNSHVAASDNMPISRLTISEEEISKPISSTINMSEVETLIRRLILEDPDSVYFLKKNYQQNNREMMEKINAFHAEFLKLQTEFKNFKKNFNKKKDWESEILEITKTVKAYDIKSNEVDDKIDHIEQKFLGLEASLNNMKNCCTNESEQLAFIKRHMGVLLENFMANEEKSNFPGFKEWLSSHFATKEMVEMALKTSATNSKTLEKANEIAINEALEKYIQTLSIKSATSSVTSDGSVLLKDNIAGVEALIKKAILLYDADKTGQTDYALESGGGSIVNTRCSETYTEHSARISILGFPLWYLQNSPRNAIQPSVHPGECWAFKENQGYLVIQLASVIKPTGFVVEHIPKSISSSGNIDSAPKDFSVHGLMSEKDFEGELLGKYSYNKDGEPLQYFPIQTENVIPYRFIELKIHSNQGNENYTCLYRFRIHGFRH